VQAAVDSVRANGGPVAPWCPFARRWLENHPDDVTDVDIDWSEPPG
jgi:predicted GNAT family acetyltransferase